MGPGKHHAVLGQHANRHLLREGRCRRCASAARRRREGAAGPAGVSTPMSGAPEVPLPIAASVCGARTCRSKHHSLALVPEDQRELVAAR